MSHFDSRPETYAHIATVREYLLRVVNDLIYRAHDHDLSKLSDPEKAVFDEFTPRLRESTYGSDEYKQFLVGMGAALHHHYEVNDHHPEHFAGGIHATLRHADGDLARSIEQNAERFGYGPEIKGLLTNTAQRFGWLP